MVPRMCVPTVITGRQILRDRLVAKGARHIKMRLVKRFTVKARQEVIGL